MPQVLAGMTERLNASYRRAEEDPDAREGFLLGPALNLASTVRARQRRRGHLRLPGPARRTSTARSARSWRGTTWRWWTWRPTTTGISPHRAGGSWIASR